MNEPYAGAKRAFEALRHAIGPWAAANGFKRTKGAQAGWEKIVHGDQSLSFRFEGTHFASPEIGHTYHGYVQLEPAGSQGSTIIRQADFGRCLVQSELDEFTPIQGAINRRRPPLPAEFAEHFNQDTILGLGLREDYDPAPRYREGQCIHFGYHRQQDVDDLAAFVARMLPAVVDRFLADRIPKAIDTTPPHLRPKWLDRVTKLPKP